jgi:hypothetical protein
LAKLAHLVGEKVMTLNGHVENGKIVLDESVALTEGMRVRVELLSEETRAENNSNGADTPPATFYERHKSWIGSIKDAPSDYAQNHDHYLHGQPKR